MTTIAYCNGEMAGDTLAMDTHGLKAYCMKISAITIASETWLFGSAGERSIGVNLAESIDGLPTFAEFISQRITCDPDDKNSAIVARGDVLFYKVGTTWQQHHNKFHALGSGRDFALAAMYLGKSALEAVEVACEFDGYSGGEIVVLRSNECGH